jgi:hypothetical protein
MEGFPSPRINEACVGCELVLLCLEGLARQRAAESSEPQMWTARDGQPAQRSLMERIAERGEAVELRRSEDAGVVITLEVATEQCPGLGSAGEASPLSFAAGCQNDLDHQWFLIREVSRGLTGDRRFEAVRNRLIGLFRQIN